MAPAIAKGITITNKLKTVITKRLKAVLAVANQENNNPVPPIKSGI